MAAGDGLKGGGGEDVRPWAGRPDLAALDSADLQRGEAMHCLSCGCKPNGGVV